MLSKSSISIAAAGAGLCFLGYCIYFDKKRRSDPKFRQKLKERRRNAANKKSSSGDPSTPKYPDLTNQKECQAFFMQEINQGEMLLQQGCIAEGVDHLANATVVCGQPQQLLQVFAQTMPLEIVAKLQERIPIVQQQMLTGQFTQRLLVPQVDRDDDPSIEVRQVSAGGRLMQSQVSQIKAEVPEAEQGPTIAELAEDDVE